MEYENFELLIDGQRQKGYSVVVLQSSVGEARAAVQYPFGVGDIQDQISGIWETDAYSLGSNGRKTPSSLQGPEIKAVKTIGHALFDTAIAGEIRSCYDLSRYRAAQEGKGLRLKLRIQSPELATLPWELMFDPRQNEFVALSRYTSIVRHVEAFDRQPPLPMELPLRILCVCVSPTDMQRFDIKNITQLISEELRELEKAGLVKLEWLIGGTWRDLQHALWEENWHIFHFIGHGCYNEFTKEGYVMLTDSRNQAAMFSAKQLARLLSDNRALRLVILSSCEGARSNQHNLFSSAASVLVQRGIPAAVAMQDRIAIPTAIEFAQSFYKSIVAGESIETAVTEARIGISFANADTLEWGLPIVYTHRTDGYIFDSFHQRASQERRP